MKSSSNFIWELVHSLSKQEKVFFKRNFASNISEGQLLYLKLFDALAKQKKYDEEKIIEQLQPLLSKKNIAFQKHYLQKQICDSLIFYNNQEAGSNDIYQQIQLIRIYRKKGLTEEAHSIWKKAVIQARKTEAFALLNLLKSEFEKMVLVSNQQTSYDELHSVFKGNIITYKEYSEMITLRDIYTEVLLLKRKAHFDLAEHDKAQLNTLLLKVTESTSEISFQSFWFRHYFYMNKATLLYLLSDSSSSIEILKHVFNEWKKNPHFIKSHGEYFIELLYMINYAGVQNGSFDYVTTVFNDKLNELLTEPTQRANYEAIKYVALNKIYNKTAKYDDVEKLIVSMKQRYKEWEPFLNADMNRTVSISLGIACFVLKKFEDALYYTKRGVTYFKDGSREDHYTVANILLLLITYSMNNSKLFDAQYRSSYNYFHKQKKQHAFEKALVQCLHRTFYMTEPRKKIEEYKKTIELFYDKDENIIQQWSFNIFNYPGWLQSKVMRIDYKDYVIQQVKKNSDKKPVLS